jgi:hypothetical protein
MLIETTQELQLYVPTSSAFKEATLTPELKTSTMELEQRVPKEFLTHIESLKGADNLGELEDIHYHFASFIGNITMYRMMPKLYNSITSAGIRTHVTQETERATKWSYEDQRNAYLLDATVHLENGLSKFYNLPMGTLMSFMSQDEIVNHKKRLFKNIDDWKSALSTRCSVLVIQELNNYVADCEESYILNRLDRGYWETTKQDPTQEFQKTLINYGRRLIASAALLRGLGLLTLSLSADGLRMTSFYYNETLHGAPLAMDFIMNLKRSLETNVTHYQGIFDKYLLQNASNIPGMTSSDFYIQSQENSSVLGGYNNENAKSTFFI